MLTPAERLTLEAVCEGFLPSLEPRAGDSTDLFRLSAASVGVPAAVEQAIVGALSESRSKELRLLLRLLGSAGFMFAAALIPRPFATLSPRWREVALRRMANHPLPDVRSGFQALRRLATFLFYSAVPEVGDNPTWAAIRYAVPRPGATTANSAALRLTRVTRATTLDCDACIVGAGAGGGVVAAKLAAAGKRVVVLEAGSSDLAADFDQREVIGMQRLYLDQGTTATKDVGVAILAGSAVGGGTSVNWQTCLRTPDWIRDEWADRSGIAALANDDFTRALDEVCARLSVGTVESPRNANNDALARGSSALGFAWETTARNANGCDQAHCGYCVFGCRVGGKQSTANTYLRDAQKGDTTIVPDCRVERVRIQGGRATGVEARVRDRATGERFDLRVNATTVVVAAGAIETPALLLRSGVRHRELGRHLYLHPTTGVAGRYDERINGWLGAPQTVVVRQFSRAMEVNGMACGYHLETAPVHPGLMAMAQPWTDARTHRMLMQHVANVSAFIVLTRDYDGGRVTLDREGRAVINYRLEYPVDNLLRQGIANAARVHHAAGASEVHTLHTNPEVWRRRDGRDFGAWLRVLRERRVDGNRCGVYSAHQMGTARMGRDGAWGVCNERGAVFRVPGLHVADASLFPASSGVNPMITVMALATLVGDAIASS